jgi:hypothetical protein
MQNTAHSFTDFTLGSAQHIVKRYNGKPARMFHAYFEDDQSPEYSLLVLEAREKESLNTSLTIIEDDSQYFLSVDEFLFDAHLVDERGNEIVVMLQSYHENGYSILAMLFDPRDAPQVY